MSGFNVDDEDEEIRAEKRENKDSWSCPHIDPKHRRSKSASDRNLEVSRSGVLCLGKKELVNEEHATMRDHISKNASNDRATTLQRDIADLQLRLQQEKSMRLVLDKTMGRVSSTLSPGHRHFSAQTKELIAEIELLEKEVTNREQHVLSLYRDIFEQCVSRVSSERTSRITSPVHAKQVPRKHPSIISSSFCSSQKFPLRPLHAMVSMYDSGKKNSKIKKGPQCCGRSDVPCGETFSTPIQVQEKVLTTEKTPMVQTLIKDHLYQCPSKLSEEMVRCMAAVYCWLCSEASAADLAKRRSPLLSRSSTNVVLPRKGTSGDKDWSCRSTVEISRISTDKSHFSQASYGINNYRVLVEQLEKVVVNQMENNAKLAFWINVYNALVMHAYLAYGVPQHSLRRLALFHKSAYNIGGQIVSANAIEHSILCFHTPRIGRWFETMLSTALRKKTAEERKRIHSKFGLPNSEPLLCFALCTGALSDPMLKVYSASDVKQELEVAKKEFLQANIVLKMSRKVFLPKIVNRFAREASISSDNLLKWVTENVDKKLKDSVQKCIDHKSTKKSAQIIEWLPYSTRFRYTISKDLTEKPWWV